MTSHLLPLSTLHGAAPGVLDMVFGADGDFEGAPCFTGPVADIGRYGIGGWRWVRSVSGRGFVDFMETAPSCEIGDLALDLRIPSVAARLAGLLLRVALATTDIPLIRQAQGALLACADGGWTEAQAARLAGMVLDHAPKIAALGGGR